MSFFLIRLLQEFSSINLDSSAQPPETRPPASWAGGSGRKGIEKIWAKMHLTMYSLVRTFNVRISVVCYLAVEYRAAYGFKWEKQTLFRDFTHADYANCFFLSISINTSLLITYASE